MSPTSPLLQVENLSVSYPSGPSVLSSIGFTIAPGEVVGLMGASGSGKSTLALALLRLLPPGSACRGLVRFEGRSLLDASDSEMRRLRGARLALVSQEPLDALNPVLRCQAQVADVVRAHRPCSARAASQTARAMLESVGLPPRAAASYPHQLSGGQRQRVVIAQALVCRPSLVIADEPTAALDTVTQAAILALLRRIQAQTAASFLFITHNPLLLTGFAHRRLTLDGGRIVPDAA